MSPTPPLDQSSCRPVFSGVTLSVLVAASVAALGVSIYLAYAGLTGSSVAGCDGGVVDCSHVLTSRWSKAAGIPVAVPAVGLWAIVTGCLFAITRRHLADRRGGETVDRSPGRWLATTVLLLTTCAAGSAIWFTGLQVFDIGHLCPYCLVAHACGLIAAVAIWRGLWNASLPMPRTGVVGISALATAGLIGVQYFSEPPPTFEVIQYDVADSAAPAADRAADPLSSPLDSPLLEAPTMEAPTLESPAGGLPASQAIARDRKSAPSPPADDASRAQPVSNILGSPLRQPTNEQISAPDVFDSPLSLRQTGVENWLNVLSWMPMGPVAMLADDTTASPPVAQKRLVPVVGGRHKLNAADWPLYGSPEDEFILAEMFDYTCSHCQATHRAIQQAKAQLGGRLAVLALPVPLHRSCNPHAKNNAAGGQVACDLAKLSIAVWLTDRDQFGPMHDWLMQTTRTSGQARAFANSLVDPDKLTSNLTGSLPEAFIQKNVFLYNQAGEGALPKVMLPTSTLVGEVGSGQTIAELVQK